MKPTSEINDLQSLHGQIKKDAADNYHADRDDKIMFFLTNLSFM